MYYEAISHTSRPVVSAAEAATLIRSGGVMSSHALIWQNSSGQRIAAVADGGLNHPWFEVAVINLDTMTQLESITFGWIEDTSTAIAYLVGCENNAPVSSRKALLPLDGAGESAMAAFECGCCGGSFKSTITEQRIHDQDEGYGFCPECLGRFSV